YTSSYFFIHENLFHLIPKFTLNCSISAIPSFTCCHKSSPISNFLSSAFRKVSSSLFLPLLLIFYSALFLPSSLRLSLSLFSASLLASSFILSFSLCAAISSCIISLQLLVSTSRSSFSLSFLLSQDSGSAPML